MNDRLFHVALGRDWHAAQTAGEYRVSTRGLSLDEVGFIHTSYAHQVAFVTNAYYAGLDDLVLLVIDRQRVHAAVRDELVPPAGGSHAHEAAHANGGAAGAEAAPGPGAADARGQWFPHIFGPLNVDAVTDVVPLVAGPDGRFALPARFAS